MKKALTFVLIFLESTFSFAQTPVSSGLIAKYCFDGDAKDALGVKNCTVFGAIPTSDRLSRPNMAYYFDGVDDYIQMPPDIWVGGEFSVSGWLYVESYKNFGRFFEFGNGTFQDNVQYTATPSGSTTSDAYSIRRQACVPGSPTHEYSNASVFPMKTWVFVTIVHRGTVGEIWRNGVYSTISSMTMAYPCAIMRNQCYFGKSPWTHDEYFHGKMDNVRIYNRALTPLEIDTLYKLDDLCSQTDITEVFESNTQQFLSQNFPNPTNGETVIAYKLPETTNEGTIGIFDISGRKIKTLDLNKNKGSVVIQKGELIPGMYFYSLITDGKTLDTKKMIITAN